MFEVLLLLSLADVALLTATHTCMSARTHVRTYILYYYSGSGGTSCVIVTRYSVLMRTYGYIHGHIRTAWAKGQWHHHQFSVLAL